MDGTHVKYQSLCVGSVMSQGWHGATVSSTKFAKDVLRLMAAVVVLLAGALSQQQRASHQPGSNHTAAGARAAQVAARTHAAPLPALGAGGRPPNGAAVHDWDPWGVGTVGAANGVGCTTVACAFLRDSSVPNLNYVETECRHIARAHGDMSSPAEGPCIERRAGYGRQNELHVILTQASHQRSSR